MHIGHKFWSTKICKLYKNCGINSSNCSSFEYHWWTAIWTWYLSATTTECSKSYHSYLHYCYWRNGNNMIIHNNLSSTAHALMKYLQYSCCSCIFVNLQCADCQSEPIKYISFKYCEFTLRSDIYRLVAIASQLSTLKLALSLVISWL